MSEIAIDLGHGVSGILSQPAHASHWPLLVLLNAGFIHRVGPFRLHVDLAREVAAFGMASLRVDLPGTGDAPPRREPDDAEVVRHALDEVARQSGITKFVVGGLCSGADLAWRVACADARVRGMVLLDPFARRGGFWFRLGQAGLLRARGIGGAFDAVRRRMQRRASVPLGASQLRDWPTPPQARSQLEQLLARDVAVFALYTGGAAAYFTHPRQFAATFGAVARDPRVQLEHWRDTDHMFLLARDRARLRHAIAMWLQRTFG